MIIERDRLMFLRKRIEKNLATEKDYEEYENIIVKNGFSKDRIDRYLAEGSLTGYDELINERNKYRERKRDNTIETVVVAGLIGLGIAVILKSIYDMSRSGK